MSLSTLNSFTNIDFENNISIITLKDNRIHTYCSKISWENDNNAPVSVAKITIPYSESIEQYWSTYDDTVVIHASLLKNSHDKRNKKVKQTKKDKKIRLTNDYYNYSFIGKVSNFKQIGKNIIVYLENIGWKFTQKVPKDFRQQYIAGQPLGNAFQAICEFIGIEFAYSIEKLNEYNFSTDGYSITKDNTTIEDVDTFLSSIETTTDTNTDDALAQQLNDKQYENQGIIDYNNSQQQSNNTNATSSQETIINNDNENNENIDPIVEKYQEDFDNKIKDLFIGNTFYDADVNNALLNYDAITVTPVNTNANTDIQTNTTSNTTSNQSSSDNNKAQTSQSNNGHQNKKSSSQKQGWINGQYYVNDKIYLSKEYINKLSPNIAEQKYKQSNAKQVYTSDTMQKLLWRSMGVILR